MKGGGRQNVNGKFNSLCTNVGPSFLEPQRLCSNRIIVKKSSACSAAADGVGMETKEAGGGDH